MDVGNPTKSQRENNFEKRKYKTFQSPKQVRILHARIIERTTETSRSSCRFPILQGFGRALDARNPTSFPKNKITESRKMKYQISQRNGTFQLHRTFSIFWTSKGVLTDRNPRKTDSKKFHIQTASRKIHVTDMKEDNPASSTSPCCRLFS